jgi:hypothetical protein
MSRRAERPGWTTEDREKANAVYVTLETVNHGKSAAELPIIMMGKWLEQHLPGTLECKPIREGKILALVKNKETANRAENHPNKKNGKYE